MSGAGKYVHTTKGRSSCSLGCIGMVLSSSVPRVGCAKGNVVSAGGLCGRCSLQVRALAWGNTSFTCCVRVAVSQIAPSEADLAMGLIWGLKCCSSCAADLEDDITDGKGGDKEQAPLQERRQRAHRKARPGGIWESRNENMEQIHQVCLQSRRLKKAAFYSSPPLHARFSQRFKAGPGPSGRGWVSLRNCLTTLPEGSPAHNTACVKQPPFPHPAVIG